MITKVRKADGTVIDFDKDYTISSLSKLLQEQADMSETESVEVATNIVQVIDSRNVDIPSTTDFEQLVNLVVNTTKLAKLNSHSKEHSEVYNSENVSELTNTEEDTSDLSETSDLVAEDPESPLEEDQAEEVDEEYVQEIQPEQKEELQADIKVLEENGIEYSEQAKTILTESTVFDELGRSIFLDRYSLKCKREDIKKGDLVVAITKEDPKYPKKDLGVVKSLEGDKVLLHMVTGLFADKENNFEFETTIWKCDKPVESIKEAHKRIAKAAASVEKDEGLRAKWETEFFNELSNKHIQPAGRIMTGANVGDGYTQNLTLYNCYVIPSPKDSREGIIQETLHQMTEIMSRGGGVGINLSTLRPRYAYVQGVHGKSSGAVSWGGLFSYATALIEQGGSRRGALMLMLQDWHPDVLEFITAKRKKGMIENANISVLFSDRFMEALSNGEDWKLEFPDYEAEGMKEIYHNEWTGDLWKWKEAGYPTKVYKTVPAAELWDMVITSAHASAEPGLVFMERYNKMSNSYYYNPIICTNPCGEQGLPAWGVCNLGHLYLASFANQVGEDEVGAVYDIDFEALKKASSTLLRFLDNIIDLTPYHFKENEDNQKGERRVGLGTLGLGELLIKMRLRYGSPESLELIDEVYKTISESAYQTSVDLAKEKGMFKHCVPEKIVESGFLKTMPEEIREQVKVHGLRNVTLTTQAPTGTVGTMLGTSTGIEPYYAFKFFRQSRLGFHEVNIPIAEDYKKEDGTLPEFFITAMEMTPLDHIRVQAAVQRWTDSSISKTANAPENFTVEQTKQLYEEAYRLGCKGVTIYRDNCRYEQVLTTDSKKGEENVNSKDWEASNEVVTNQETEVVEEDLASDEVLENQVEIVEEIQESTVQELQMAEEESSGQKCELRFDENGQMYKSCSD